MFILVNEREKLQLILGSDHYLFPNIELKRLVPLDLRETVVARHLKFIVDYSLIIRKYDVVLITFLFQRMIMSIIYINK